MCSWEKSLREEKLRKNPKNPSFSSNLLDEIYRSIDGGSPGTVDEKSGRKEKFETKQSIIPNSSAVGDEEMASLRRACLVEKWMEMKVNEKVSTRKASSLSEFDRRSVPPDNDPIFFSSSSSSSDSSFGWFSETDQAAQPKGRKPSCFGPFRPKPVKTSVSKQNEFYLFDDHHNHQTNKTEEGLIKSKTRALKIYGNLKKAKQPISPGGKLTTFLNSLFTNGQAKKSAKDLNLNSTAEWKSKSTQASTCSSASSFSRSCLSKTSPRSRDKLKTVRFYPVSVIVDEQSRPCGQKIICDEQDFETALPWQRKEELKFPRLGERNLNGRRNIDEEDMSSDSSSDLFELDHLAVFKNDSRFCEELPVYETTHFGSGFIR